MILSVSQTNDTVARLNSLCDEVAAVWLNKAEQIRDSIHSKKKERAALALLDRASDGSWLLFIQYDKEGKMKWPPYETLSEQFCNEFGYRRKELNPDGFQAWREICDKSKLPEVDKAFMSHLKNGGDYSIVLDYFHKDGHRIKVLCRGSIMNDDKGRPSIMYGSHTNLTKLGI